MSPSHPSPWFSSSKKKNNNNNNNCYSFSANIQSDMCTHITPLKTQVHTGDDAIPLLRSCFGPSVSWLRVIPPQQTGPYVVLFHSNLTSPLTGGNLGYFQSFAAANSAAGNILALIPSHTSAASSPPKWNCRTKGLSF